MRAQVGVDAPDPDPAHQRPGREKEDEDDEQGQNRAQEPDEKSQMEAYQSARLHPRLDEPPDQIWGSGQQQERADEKAFYDVDLSRRFSSIICASTSSRLLSSAVTLSTKLARTWRSASASMPDMKSRATPAQNASRLLAGS